MTLSFRNCNLVMMNAFSNQAMTKTLKNNWKGIAAVRTRTIQPMTTKKDNYDDESWDDSVDYDNLWKSSMSNPLPTSEWNDDDDNIDLVLLDNTTATATTTTTTTIVILHRFLR
jgi:hypothetical protein